VYTKICKTCGEDKELSDYGKEKRNLDGYTGSCKLCIATYKKGYYQDNKGCISSKERAYRQLNKEKRATKRKEYYQAHKEQTAITGKKYRQSEQGRTNLNNSKAKRRAIKYNTAVSNTELDNYLIKCVYTFCRFKTKETGVLHHVDHIKALAKGGAHHWSNLQILTATENLIKGDR